MKKENRKFLFIGTSFIILFVIWTLLVKYTDVRAIGPRDSQVGFGLLNVLFHKLTGVHMSLYTVTDWLGLVPLFMGVIFAAIGLCQLIKRKKLLSVDFDILALGIFYVAVIFAYIFFEIHAVNYRPVLINNILEVSYPSSTTLLAMTFLPTAIMQIKIRIKNRFLCNLSAFFVGGLLVFMVIGRIISGVHWISDIIGGAMLGAGLDLIYYSFVR